ncbi:unnamed protein product [Camellia sinensis]
MGTIRGPQFGAYCLQIGTATTGDYSHQSEEIISTEIFPCLIYLICWSIELCFSFVCLWSYMLVSKYLANKYVMVRNVLIF